MSLFNKLSLPASVSLVVFLSACGSGDSKLSSKPDSDDTTPPTISDIATATASGATNINVTWTAATDDTTTPGNMRYIIYASTSATRTGSALDTITGMTSYNIHNLVAGTTYYVTIEAVNEANNSSISEATGEATTSMTVSFALDIEPALIANCTSSSCHDNTVPSAGLDLSNGAAYSNIVGINMSGCTPGKFITPGTVATSLMLTKLDWTADAPCGGALMPKDGAQPPQSFLNAMKSWIEEDALDN